MRSRPVPVAQRVALIRRARHAGRARAMLVHLVLAAVLLGLVAAALVAGDGTLPVAIVFDWATGQASPLIDHVLGDLRLPRVLTAALAGAAFGLSGAVFQSLLRNPLASPDVIGISAGASTAAVLGVLAGLGGLVVPLLAFAGAVLTAVAIYLLAWRRGVTGYRMVLVGIGVAAGLNGVIRYVSTRADVEHAQLALVWLTGSLNNRTWAHAGPLLAALLVLVPVTLPLARSLRTLQLGDDTASGLGTRVQPARFGLVLVATALAAAGTAACGPVSFVAFLSAPIARRLLRGRSTALLAAALVGAVVVSAADLLAQNLLSDSSFPVGVLTGLVGAPYLLWLLRAANRTGRAG